MNKEEYLERLRKSLRNIPIEEAENMIRYYIEYFEDAGVENEKSVVDELGSPELLAVKLSADYVIKDIEKRDEQQAAKKETRQEQQSMESEDQNNTEDQQLRDQVGQIGVQPEQSDTQTEQAQPNTQDGRQEQNSEEGSDNQQNSCQNGQQFNQQNGPYNQQNGQYSQGQQNGQYSQGQQNGQFQNGQYNQQNGQYNQQKGQFEKQPNSGWQNNQVKREFSNLWVIILAICAFPIWLPLVITAAALLFSLVIVVLALLFAAAVAATAITCGGIAAFVGGIAMLFVHTPTGIMALGMGSVCIGIGLLGVWISIGLVKFTKYIFINIAKIRVKKGVPGNE